MVRSAKPLAPLDSNSENYLVSVSDLMAGLIFLFILTLMAFVLEFKIQEKDFKTEAEAHSRKQKEYQQEIDSLKEFSETVKDTNKVRQQLLEEISSCLKKLGVQVTIDHEQGILRLPDSILFPSGSATLRTEGKQKLSRLADVLATVLPCYSGKLDETLVGCESGRTGKLEAVFIEGHTDDIPISTPAFPDNWTLSTARAIRTYQTIVGVQPGLDQLRNYKDQPIFSVSGYAHRRPVIPNTDATARQENRRIDLRFVMVSPTDPGAMERVQERLKKSVVVQKDAR